jgi:beta-lactamase regulating signal transducer with metallopeptidase domain
MSLDWTTAARWLLHCAVGGGLLLLLTCLLIRCTRQPARRQRLGELGLAAALVLAVLSLQPPWLVVAWPVSSAPAPPVVRAEPEPPRDVVVEEEIVLAGPAPPWEAVPGEPPIEPAPPEPAPAAPAGQPWWHGVLLLLPWLVVAHALCAAVLLGRWLLGHYALRRLLRAAGPAPTEVAALFEAMAPRRLGARLLVARRLRVPLSFGLLRPTVVLPAGLCDPPDLQKLRWVFAHELTHLERRDAWSALLFALGQAVYFFLPWFAWLRRQVRLCQEYVADAAAASQEEPAVDYAEFLLSLTGAPAVPAAAASVSGSCSDLYRRVTMLLKEPLRVEKRCPRRWSLAAAGGLFALAILVGGFGVRADAAPQVVIIIPGEDTKPARPKEARKVRVLVVPGRDGAALKPVPQEVGGKLPEIRLIQDSLLIDKPAGAGEGDRVLIIRKVLAKPSGEPAEVKLLLRVPPDVRYEDVRKILEKLQEKPGLHQLKAVRDDLRKLLAQAGLSVRDGDGIRVLIEDVRKDTGQGPDRVRVRVDQQPEKVLILKHKGTEPGPGRHNEAAIELLHKALEQLGKEPAKPDMDRTKESLKKALEWLRQRGARELGHYPPAKALVVPAVPRGGGPPVELQLVPKGKRPVVVPDPAARSVDPELLRQLLHAIQKQDHARAQELAKKALDAVGRKDVRWEWGVEKLPRVKERLSQDGWEIVRHRVPGPARLGVTVEKPSAALADQLNLPASKGLIITAVKSTSPAEKAGLKVNDVLVELNGQAVESDPGALARTLEAHKPGATLTAVVLRKGKREMVRQIALPGAPAEKAFWQVVPRPGEKVKPGDVLTTLFRAGERFTTRYQEGSLIITVTGTVAGGKAKVGEIQIQDGRQEHKYDSVERVPAQYRDKVAHLVEMSGRGEMRIQGTRP